MFIHEAIKARTSDKPFIMREKWADMFGARRGVKLFPTDSPDGFILHSSATRSAQRGWQPEAEDLVADDWITSV